MITRIFILVLCAAALSANAKDKYFLAAKQDQTNEFSKTLPVELQLPFDTEADALSSTGKVDKAVKGEADIYLIHIDKNGVKTTTKVKEKKAKSKGKP